MDLYLRRARRAGIDRTIVFPAFHNDYAKANAQLARLIQRNPKRLIGFAFVHCARDADRIHAMTEQAVREWNFRGIKVHGSDAPASREVCEAARSLRVPLLVDIGGNTPPVEMMASQYPDVSFIIPHLGSFSDDWRAHQQVVDQLVRWPNVYADTSGVRRFDYLVQAARRAGPNKLLFGSDGCPAQIFRPSVMQPSSLANIRDGVRPERLWHARCNWAEGGVGPQSGVSVSKSVPECQVQDSCEDAPVYSASPIQ